MLVIPALKRMRQEDHEIKARLHIETPVSKKSLLPDLRLGIRV
jgi:hypothetical protein